ncbi:unnamed protein product, partial [Musa textilis]
TRSSISTPFLHWGRWKLCEPTTAMLDGCPIVSCSSCPTLICAPSQLTRSQQNLSLVHL